MNFNTSNDHSINLRGTVDRIQWYEGMLLMPQHFQSADQRVDDLFRLHLHHGLIQYWGIISCRIDEAALMVGKINVLQLSVIMPDGTFYTMTDDDRERLSLDIKLQNAAHSHNMITIHLGLPEYTVGRSAVNNDNVRYRSADSPRLNDENTGDAEQRIPILRPNVCLFTDDHLSSRYVSFPLLRIVKNNHAYKRDQDFIAPQLKVTMGDDLGYRVMNVAQRVRSKIVFLSKQLQNQGDDLLSQDVKQALRGLSIGLLPFEAVLKSESAHPFVMYRELCHLAGCVAMLQPATLPPSFDAYNHNDLYQTFEQVIRYIDTMLDHVQENYDVLRFDRNDRTFSLSLQQPWESHQLIIGVKIPKGSSKADMALWIKNAVIATATQVSSVRERRILGARRVVIDDESDVKLKPAEDSLLFVIYSDRDFIDYDDILTIFNVADTATTRPLEVVLYLPMNKFTTIHNGKR